MNRRAFLLGGASVICLAYPEQGGAQSDRWTLARERIAATESRLGGRLGVAALDISTKRRIEYRAEQRFPMCSTFKLLLVARVLSLSDAKHLGLGQTVPYTQSDLLDYAPITRAHLADGGMTIEALCAAAIEYSDNTAANLLLKVTGGPKGVTHYARTLGDYVTRLDRTEPALNTAIPGDPRDTTSPHAMLQDMQKILIERKALLPESRKLLQVWLEGDTLGRNFLRAGLPTGWRAGDKIGMGKNGSLNDIAICWPSNRAPILVAAYSVGSPATENDHATAFAEVARIVTSTFS